MDGTSWLSGSRARAVLQASVLAFGLLRAVEAGASDCRPSAATFREALESVVEAEIDGRPAQVLASAHRADVWWNTHHAAFVSHPGADSMMRALRSAAGHRAYIDAAAIAVRTAVASFEWCGAPASDSEQLFVLDLAGMTGWLRARGAALEWPPGVSEATDAIASRLMTHHNVQLAARLRGTVKAALGTPVAVQGATKGATQAATSLLDLVDVIEKALK